jgi:hypothetical protein
MLSGLTFGNVQVAGQQTPLVDGWTISFIGLLRHLERDYDLRQNN